jgi:hypothetical protein
MYCAPSLACTSLTRADPTRYAYNVQLCMLHLHPASTNTWSIFNDPKYQHAISATVGILQEYDSDKKFPVYGFGGIPPGGRDVDHCFALNLNPSNPEVAGSHGVLQVRVQNVFLHASCNDDLARRTMF